MMEKFREWVIGIKNTPYRWWQQVKLQRRVTSQLRQKNSLKKHKVFGIGLSKTGTTSLADALQHLGYTSLHWSYGKNNGRVIGWPEFFYADAATDITVSAQFESLYHTFENSKFIYTVRNIDQWKKSIVRHLDGIESPKEWQITRNDRYLRPGRFQSFIRRIQALESLYCQHDSWERAYYTFDQRVKRFFENKPDSRFLKLNIIDGEQWEPLCNFLGYDIPDSSFPHSNQSSK